MPRTLFTILVFAVAAIFHEGAAAQTVAGRYIVELDVAPVADHILDKSAGPQRTRVRSQQARFRGGLSRRARVLGSVETVANAVFVSIPDDEAAQLAAMPGVRSVHPVREFQMVMDRAVNVNRVTDAWNRIGIENAGAGMKIAIIDSGVDAEHPGLQDPTLAIPASFPKVNSEGDQQFTNTKVIVARSYVNLLARTDPDQSARDHVGHGTALAMVSAGSRTAGPLATIVGVAPRAYIGSYKIFGSPGVNTGATDDAIISAIDAAVNDGMDVINLSIGTDIAPRIANDVVVQAVERATRAGAIVVVAAGNNGPELTTLGSPATAPSAISVGASRNDRIFATAATIPGLPPLIAQVSDGARPTTPVAGAVADVAALDGTGLGCEALPSGSMTGRIALILRGSCNFQIKLNNAQQAGAVAALVFAAADAPDPIAMAVGTATLPAQMISHSDGLALKARIAADPSAVASLSFVSGPVAVDPARVASFSGVGPSVDGSIKPDLIAVGSSVYTATQRFDTRGAMYSANGFIVVNGTSFSTPLMAGAAALLKGARPGLTVEQYKSLLVNSATPVNGPGGTAATLAQAGAGALDLGASLAATATAVPASLYFGAGAEFVDARRSLTLTNTGASASGFSISVAPAGDSSAPALANTNVELGPGASAEIPVMWQAVGLRPGAHEGFLRILSSATGNEIRVPYRYAVRSEPVSFAIISQTTGGRIGATIANAIQFRVLDAAGLPVLNAEVQVTAVEGGAPVGTVRSLDSTSPGLYRASITLGLQPGSQRFRLKAGAAEREIAIPAQ